MGLLPLTPSCVLLPNALYVFRGPILFPPTYRHAPQLHIHHRHALEKLVVRSFVCCDCLGLLLLVICSTTRRHVCRCPTFADSSPGKQAPRTKHTHCNEPGPKRRAPSFCTHLVVRDVAVPTHMHPRDQATRRPFILSSSYLCDSRRAFDRKPRCLLLGGSAPPLFKASHKQLLSLIQPFSHLHLQPTQQTGWAAAEPAAGAPARTARKKKTMTTTKACSSSSLP